MPAGRTGRRCDVRTLIQTPRVASASIQQVDAKGWTMRIWLTCLAVCLLFVAQSASAADRAPQITEDMSRFVVVIADGGVHNMDRHASRECGGRPALDTTCTLDRHVGGAHWARAWCRVYTLLTDIG